MKLQLYSFIQQNSNNSLSEDELQAVVVGLMTGLALALLDTPFATTVHLSLLREWSLDPQNPQQYGPSAMASTLLQALKREMP